MRGSVDRDVWTVLFDIEKEVERAAQLHGAGFDRPNLPPWCLQYHTDLFDMPSAHDARARCEQSFELKAPNWAEIFIEEVCEALEETGDGNDDKLRTELIQVAAVAAAWVRTIDSRRAGAQPDPMRAGRSDDNRT